MTDYSFIFSIYEINHTILLTTENVTGIKIQHVNLPSYLFPPRLLMLIQFSNSLGTFKYLITLPDNFGLNDRAFFITLAIMINISLSLTEVICACLVSGMKTVSFLVLVD